MIPRFTKRLSELSILLFLVFISFITYHEILDFFFTSTDALTLIETSRVSSFSDIKRILTEKLAAGTGLGEKVIYYRPIQSLSYSFDYLVWNLNPFGYHLTDLGIYILTTVLIYILGSIFLENRYLAILPALIFALHPMLLNNVPAIARRNDMMVSLFGTASLIFFMKFVNGKSGFRKVVNLSISVLLCLLAMGSKEIGVIYPFIIISYFLLIVNAEKRESISCIYPYLIGFIFFFLLRYFVLGGFGGRSYENYPPLDYWDEIRGVYFEALLQIPYKKKVVIFIIVIALLIVLLLIKKSRMFIVNYWANIRERDIGLFIFLITWLLLPLIIYVVTDELQARNLINSIVPFALLIGLFVKIFNQKFTQGHKLFRVMNISFTLLIAVWLIRLVYISPLITSHQAWKVSSDVTEACLNKISRTVEKLPQNSEIKITNLPRLYVKKGVRYTNSSSILRKHSVTSWLKLKHPDKKISLGKVITKKLHQIPMAVDINIEDGAIRVLKINLVY